MKLDKPGELRDVDVTSVSLVTAAANRKKFGIFKCEKGGRDVGENTEYEGGLYKVLKEFFTGEKSEEVKKGVVADAVASKTKTEKFSKAFWVLERILVDYEVGLASNGDFSGATKAAQKFAEICAAIADSTVAPLAGA